MVINSEHLSHIHLSEKSLRMLHQNKNGNREREMCKNYLTTTEKQSTVKEKIAMQ